MTAQPFLKWVGGKRSLLPVYDQLGITPHSFNNYFEPFLGGGAMFYHLANRGAIKGTAYLSDINESLIAAYTVIKEAPDIVIGHLRELRGMNNKESFEWYKVLFNDLKLNRGQATQYNPLMRKALMAAKM